VALCHLRQQCLSERLTAHVSNGNSGVPAGTVLANV
jgi:hypothetical protein